MRSGRGHEAASRQASRSTHSPSSMMRPLIRSHCLVHDKYYRLAGVHTVALRDPKSHFGAGHQNLDAVLKEV